MKELIKIREQNGERAVNARELHNFLKVGRDFSTWIKERINQYKFVENQDYQILSYDYKGNLLNIRLPKIGESVNQHVSKTEYVLSIDMAKELSMIENNERGRQARKYFIECEKRLHNIQTTKERDSKQYIPRFDKLEITLANVGESWRSGYLIIPPDGIPYLRLKEIMEAIGTPYQNPTQKETYVTREDMHTILRKQKNSRETTVDNDEKLLDVIINIQDAEARKILYKEMYKNRIFKLSKK